MMVILFGFLLFFESYVFELQIIVSLVEFSYL